jgi:hypothetical protein
VLVVSSVHCNASRFKQANPFAVSRDSVLTS